MKKKNTALRTIFTAGILASAMTFHVFAAQITEEKAVSIALQNAGVKSEDVSYIHKETDREDGRLVYEVEFMTNDNKEYDYEIDAGTGEIISWSCENKGPGKTSNTASAAISLEEAKTAALNYAGVKSEDVTWKEVESDYDDGRRIYEGSFFCGATEYEFEIDAATGAVLEWDVEQKKR